MKKIIEWIEYILGLGGTKKDITLLIVSGAALVISIIKPFEMPFDIAWVAIILCGLPIVLEAIIGLITEFDIKADVLVSIALVASVFIGEDFAAGEVAFIMQLGSLLEELTVARARAGIEKLVKLTPQTARVIDGDSERIIPSEEVRIGNILRVLPGETVPVDGIIISGNTSVNQAVMTGESLPVDKGEGDEVSSGTVNQFGSFEMRAVKVGEDSSIQRMIRLVQSADAGKAKIVGIADRWATWIVIIALTAAVLTGLITGEIIRAVTILVVFCPCALVLATPTAIMAAIGNATKHGFLVRQGDALERLAGVSKITFDKTGTLTYGMPQAVEVRTTGEYSEFELFRYAAAAELYSEHPLGKALVNSYKQKHGTDGLSAADFMMIPGRGVSAKAYGKNIIAGNEELLLENNVRTDSLIKTAAEHSRKKGCTIIYISVDGVTAGYIAMADTLRKESADMIKDINALGVQPVLLTGDHENAAKTISDQIGIREFYAGCLPEDKLEKIDMYQKNGSRVCMIGDGINDAPALKKQMWE